jgi:DNA-binding GntR family transcriptional regulator
MSEKVVSEVITAQTRAAFEQKVKDKLKACYSQGSEVNVNEFSQKYGVRTSNVRKAVEALEKEGYVLKLPTAVPRPKPSEQR